MSRFLAVFYGPILGFNLFWMMLVHVFLKGQSVPALRLTYVNTKKLVLRLNVLLLMQSAGILTIQLGSHLKIFSHFNC
jgi:hypothetical protein